MDISPAPPAYSAAPIIDPCRCTHYSPCACPSLPEHAQWPLRRRRDEWSPMWLQQPIDDEDPNKIIAKIMKKERWRYMMKDIRNAFTHLFFNSQRSHQGPPPVRSFRWLVSCHYSPEDYQYVRTPPWRMLVRLYCHDLPKELKDEKDRWSMRSWRDHPPKVSNQIRARVESDNAPAEITCGRRYVFSLMSPEMSQSLVGDWLAVVYIWATDRKRVENTDGRDLISLGNLVGIRAWEWVDAVDAPHKTPYLFYELSQESDRTLKDTVFGGLPYANYDSLPIHPEDPLPARLAGLRRLMNTEGRELASAYYD
ncbi:hypothetical protein M431DRAFT_72717 [Trichoderma harzianum CBS 226.95]|uniref:Uncharacterized protein n=1 Tax=Trichoderma harzianum CBS 226.95 TaxID=983964 RepID=A0A2T4AST5_TRIHA|nr:hypothetical protein M431DRAFT_72717 [Trichoderma harzianum CBS 226.95]PTB60099.1 hypothetical protein M431DRAFT_72717 [Trichoderma harzianum CBS 226.95]